ncbi:MAG: hypothetical protein AAB546_04880 [Patescibacteria group bacterium]
MSEIDNWFKFESVEDIQTLLDKIQSHTEEKWDAIFAKLDDDCLIETQTHGCYIMSTDFVGKTTKIIVTEVVFSDEEYYPLERAVTITLKKNGRRWKYSLMQIANPTDNQFISGFINLVLEE